MKNKLLKKLVIGIGLAVVVFCILTLIGYSYHFDRKAQEKTEEKVLEEYLKPTESEAPVKVVGKMGSVVIVEPLFEPSVHISVMVENIHHYPLESRWLVVETHYQNGEVVRRLEKEGN